MKFFKITFIMAACVAIFSSCSKDVEEVTVEDVKVDMTFGLSTSSSMTRAKIDGFNSAANIESIKWEETDKVTVFAQGHEVGDVFSFEGYGDLSNQGLFKGKSYSKAGTYYVLYPAQSEARLTSNGLKFNIPAEQKAYINSFDPKACIQIGKGDIEEANLAMKNVCAYFYVKVEPGCNYVEIEATDETWHLSGTCTSNDVTSGGVHITEFGDDCTNKVKLINIPAEGGTFFISFIPSTAVGSGLNVTAGYEAGVVTYEIKSKPNTQFNAGWCYDLGEI